MAPSETADSACREQTQSGDRTPVIRRGSKHLCLLYNLDIFAYMYVPVLSVCALHGYSDREGQKRMLDPLDLSIDCC